MATTRAGSKSLSRAARPIDLEDFVEIASAAALRAMQSHATPNPDDPGTSKRRGVTTRPPIIWNPHIIVGLIIRNELGGDAQVLQGLENLRV
jgi:hypothetical protein